ncbi:MAG: hypothetical protein JWM25_1247 [Thermoleophilia bacterium]|nr:hypothetical protein [Thermoleophilia bacterium]MCZ4496664.1 hypothetical protein [Thermoleophilia bacterium]
MDPRRSQEDAFSLVEILVVIVILAILMAVSLGTLRGSKDAGSTTRVLGAATSYVDAIEQFSKDARGRYPRAIGSVDWPTGTVGPVSALARGNGEYLRSVPEAVQQQVVGVGSAGRDGRLNYVPTAARNGYELQVLGKGDVYRCSFSKNVTRTGLKPCTIN